MRLLWKREWISQRKELCIQLLLELLCVAVLFIVYQVKKSLLFKTFSYVLALPAPVYAFLGLPEGVVTGNLAFCIQFVLMLLNVWIAWSFCSRAVQNIWREERTGSIYTLCNQWYTRRQLALGKYLWSIASFAVNYLLLYVTSCILMAAGSLRNSQSAAYAGKISGMMLGGMFVIVFLISVCTCYAMAVKRRNSTSFITGIIIVPIIIANLFKIRNLLLFLAEKAEISLEWSGGLLDKLYWLSPMSWINPFAENDLGTAILQMIICIVLSALAVWYGCRKYQCRNFSD